MDFDIFWSSLDLMASQKNNLNETKNHDPRPWRQRLTEHRRGAAADRGAAQCLRGSGHC